MVRAKEPKKPKSKSKKEPERKMTPQEKIEWDALYWYVFYSVMGYVDGQVLNQTMCLRLKGLQVNKSFLDGDKKTDSAYYSYDVILNTFKYCSMQIEHAKKKPFKGDMQKFFYICKIVETELNTVYKAMQKVEYANEIIDRCDVSDVVNYNATFKTRKNTKPSYKLDDLW